MLIDKILTIYAVLLVIALPIWVFYAVGSVMFRRRLYLQLKQKQNAQLVEMSEELEKAFSPTLRKSDKIRPDKAD